MESVLWKIVGITILPNTQAISTFDLFTVIRQNWFSSNILIADLFDLFIQNDFILTRVQWKEAESSIFFSSSLKVL